MNDAGTAWTGPVVPNGVGPLRNSQCQFSAAQSSATGTGNALTVRIAVTFTTSFLGTQNIYLQSSGAAGTTGWQQMGIWTNAPLPPGPPITDPSYVTGNYIGVLGRDPDPSGWIGWTVGLQQAAVDRLGLTAAFLTSTEYTNNYPSATAAAPFITLLYENALNREPEPGAVDSYTAAMAAGRTRPQVAQDFIYSAEFASVNGPRADSYHSAWVGLPPAALPQDWGDIAQTVTLTYSNPYGGTEIASGQILVSAQENVETSGGCAVTWYSNGWLILTPTSGGAVDGQAKEVGIMTGDVCSIDKANSSVELQGDKVTVTLLLTFPSTFLGWHSLYTQATNIQGLTNPLSQVGSVSIRTPSTITQTVTSSPAGLSLTIDGFPCTTPCIFQWAPGSPHTIAAASLLGETTQYVFTGWSDEGTASHTVTPPASAAYTAHYTIRYFLITTSNPAMGGTISPPSGWYDNGTIVSVSAVAFPGYSFAGFSGGLTGTTTPQPWAILGAPPYLAASFTPPGTVSNPTFTPPTGSYPPSEKVILSTVTPGATIRFTTDLSTPTCTHGSTYSSSIPLSSEVTIKAIACAPALADSQVVSSLYKIVAVSNDPTREYIRLGGKVIAIENRIQ